MKIQMITIVRMRRKTAIGITT